MKEEIDGILPFLDVAVKRIDNKLDLKIYRKLTFTSRFITSDSFHSFQQKNDCLQQHGTSIDEHFIVELGRNNGYKDQEIKNIIQKYEITNIPEI
jgi:hypothetical protein